MREAGERDPKVLHTKVEEMLEVMEMEGQEDKMPESLSGGMKKRVGLARSIIRRPSCVLYDEPTSGLDPVVADSINRLIRRLQQRLWNDEHCRHSRYEKCVRRRRITLPTCTRDEFIFTELRASFSNRATAHSGFSARAL